MRGQAVPCCSWLRRNAHEGSPAAAAVFRAGPGQTRQQPFSPLDVASWRGVCMAPHCSANTDSEALTGGALRGSDCLNSSVCWPCASGQGTASHRSPLLWRTQVQRRHGYCDAAGGVD